MIRYISLGMVPLLAACATVAPAGPVTGSWGGRHVGMVLTTEGGTLDYDCAAGRINGPVMVGPDGRFAAPGIHTPGMGGPEQQGEVRPSYPAHYSGSVRGDRMILRVDVPARGIVIGPYELRRGADPILMRCL
jgi:hypothetical protein